MQEEWKKIDEYPNYSVSNLGKVRNDRTGRILKPVKYGNYYRVTLYRDSHLSHKNVLVHRLVATAFVQNPGNKPQVNHLNGDGLDNAVDNLEWNSQSENIIHAYRVLKRRMGLASKKVVRIEDGKVFNSLKEAANACGLKHYAPISNCLRGYKGRQTAGGYHWKFYEK